MSFLVKVLAVWLLAEPDGLPTGPVPFARASEWISMWHNGFPSDRSKQWSHGSNNATSDSSSWNSSFFPATSEPPAPRNGNSKVRARPPPTPWFGAPGGTVSSSSTPSPKGFVTEHHEHHHYYFDTQTTTEEPRKSSPGLVELTGALKNAGIIRPGKRKPPVSSGVYLGRSLYSIWRLPEEAHARCFMELPLSLVTDGAVDTALQGWAEVSAIDGGRSLLVQFSVPRNSGGGFFRSVTQALGFDLQRYQRIVEVPQGCEHFAGDSRASFALVKVGPYLKAIQIQLSAETFAVYTPDPGPRPSPSKEPATFVDEKQGFRSIGPCFFYSPSGMMHPVDYQSLVLEASMRSVRATARRGGVPALLAALEFPCECAPWRYEDIQFWVESFPVSSHQTSVGIFVKVTSDSGDEAGSRCSEVQLRQRPPVQRA